MGIHVDRRLSGEQGRPRWSGLKSSLTRRMSLGELAVGWVCGLLLAAFVVFPAVAMGLLSLRPTGTLPLSAGPLTGASMAHALSQLLSGPMLLNTLVFSVGGLAVALVISVPFAYLTERTDLAGRNLLYLVMFLPMSIPAFAYALSWVLLLNPQAGMINDLLRHFLGRSPSSVGPLSIFSLAGLVWVQGTGIAPSIWLILVSVFRNFNRVHEDASRINGIGLLGTVRRITLPLMRPGLGAVVILFLLAGFYSLDIAIAIAPGARVPLFPTVVFFDIQPSNATGLPDYSGAACFGVLALLVGLIMIGIYVRLVHQAGAYATVTGRDFQPARHRLGRWCWLAYAGFAVYGVIAVILPIGILVYASLLRYYTAPGMGTLQWTLGNFAFATNYGDFWQFFINTLIVAGCAALGSAALANVIAWLYVRRRSPLTWTLNILSFIPLAIPGAITSLAFFAASVGTPLYQSLIVMIAAYVSGYLPFSVRLAHSAQVQVGGELEDAARVAGARSHVSMLRINLPLVQNAFVNSALWVFIHAAKDFAVGLILAGGSTALVANVIYNNYSTGYFPLAAAMMLVLVAFSMIAVVLVRTRLGDAQGLR